MTSNTFSSVKTHPKISICFFLYVGIMWLAHKNDKSMGLPHYSRICYPFFSVNMVSRLNMYPKPLTITVMALSVTEILHTLGLKA
jgi:hypothetical protein